MSNNGIKYINYNEQEDKDVLEVANELARLEQRKPHDSIRLLILEAGKAKITRLRQEIQEKSGKKNYLN